MGEIREVGEVGEEGESSRNRCREFEEAGVVGVHRPPLLPEAVAACLGRADQHQLRATGKLRAAVEFCRLN